MLRLYAVFFAPPKSCLPVHSASLDGRWLAMHKFVKFFKTRKNFRGAAQQPAADVLNRHPANQINGNAYAMREGQLALRAGAASGVLVPIADDGVAVVLDQIKIVGNDLLDRPAKAPKIALLPGAKLAGLNFSQVFHLVFGRIVNLMAEGLEHWSDFGTPALTEVRRVLNGACEIEKHER